MAVLRLKIKQKTSFSQIFSTYWPGPTRIKNRYQQPHCESDFAFPLVGAISASFSYPNKT